MSLSQVWIGKLLS